MNHHQRNLQYTKARIGLRRPGEETRLLLQVQFESVDLAS